MVEREQPDGIVCCASFDAVADVAVRLIPTGLPLLVEKPPGTSLAEFEALCELAFEHGTPLMVGLNRRHYSVLQQALEHAGGREHVEGVFVQWSETPERWYDRGFSSGQVEKMVFGNSLHGLDLLTFIGGVLHEPQIAVRGTGPLEWSMGLQGVSASDTLLSFHSTWNTPARWRLEISAAGRRYVFAPLESCEVLGTDAVTIVPHEDDQRFKPGFLQQARLFTTMIESGDVPACASLDSVRPAMRLADALMRTLLSTAAA
jgi:predicted dehydrogenase